MAMNMTTCGLWWVVAVGVLGACAGEDGTGEDASMGTDATPMSDARVLDALPMIDAPSVDAAGSDAEPMLDAEAMDADIPDAGPEDASLPDASPPDASPPDASLPECPGADRGLISRSFMRCADGIHAGQSAAAGGVTCAQVCCVLGFSSCRHRAAQADFRSCMPRSPSRSGTCSDVFRSTWSSQCRCNP